MLDQNSKLLFENFKRDLLSVDPVSWAEHYLQLEGEKFSLHQGYEPWIEIYRLVAEKIIFKM
jgi:hypothetical protein